MLKLLSSLGDLSAISSQQKRSRKPKTRRRPPREPVPSSSKQPLESSRSAGLAPAVPEDTLDARRGGDGDRTIEAGPESRHSASLDGSNGQTKSISWQQPLQAAPAWPTSLSQQFPGQMPSQPSSSYGPPSQFIGQPSGLAADYYNNDKVSSDPPWIGESSSNVVPPTKDDSSHYSQSGLPPNRIQQRPNNPAEQSISNQKAYGRPTRPRKNYQPGPDRTSTANSDTTSKPLQRFVDWWNDYEDVRRMEEYTEYIGVCRDCFDSSSPGRDPRAHRPHRHSRYARQASRRDNASSRGPVDLELGHWRDRPMSSSENNQNDSRIWSSSLFAANPSNGDAVPHGQRSVDQERKPSGSTRRKPARDYVTYSSGDSSDESDHFQYAIKEIRQRHAYLRQQERQKKTGGIFSFNNASSSSADPNLAYGIDNFSNNVEPQSRSDRHIEQAGNTAFSGLSAAIAALFAIRSPPGTRSRGEDPESISYSSRVYVDNKRRSWAQRSGDESWESLTESDAPSNASAKRNTTRRQGKFASAVNTASTIETPGKDESHWKTKNAVKPRSQVPEARSQSLFDEAILRASSEENTSEPVRNKPTLNRRATSSSGGPLEAVFPISTTDPHRFDVDQSSTTSRSVERAEENAFNQAPSANLSLSSKEIKDVLPCAIRTNTTGESERGRPQLDRALSSPTSIDQQTFHIQDTVHYVVAHREPSWIGRSDPEDTSDEEPFGHNTSARGIDQSRQQTNKEPHSEMDVLADFQERYSSVPPSMADFFVPSDLHSHSSNISTWPAHRDSLIEQPVPQNAGHSFISAPPAWSRTVPILRVISPTPPRSVVGYARSTDTSSPGPSRMYILQDLNDVSTDVDAGPERSFSTRSVEELPYDAEVDDEHIPLKRSTSGRTGTEYVVKDVQNKDDDHEDFHLDDLNSALLRRSSIDNASLAYDTNHTHHEGAPRPTESYEVHSHEIHDATRSACIAPAGGAEGTVAHDSGSPGDKQERSREMNTARDLPLRQYSAEYSNINPPSPQSREETPGEAENTHHRPPGSFVESDERYEPRVLDYPQASSEARSELPRMSSFRSTAHDEGTIASCTQVIASSIDFATSFPQLSLTVIR